MLASVIIFSCDNDAKPDACGLELKLVKITSSWTPGQSTSGYDMPYQETITLSTDSSFVKHRVQEGAAAEERGAYTYVTLDNKQYLQLTYDNAGNDLRTSCSPNELIEMASSTAFNNTAWMACDGPVLSYEAHATACND